MTTFWRPASNTLDRLDLFSVLATSPRVLVWSANFVEESRSIRNKDFLRALTSFFSGTGELVAMES